MFPETPQLLLTMTLVASKSETTEAALASYCPGAVHLESTAIQRPYGIAHAPF